jgi:hypothetical protein
LEEVRKRGPEPWLYFGTYPGDTWTTFFSPPFQNSFARAGAPFNTMDAAPRVRWDEHYRLEFAGVVAMGTDGAVAVTLPEEWGPDVDDFWTIAVLSGATPGQAQAYLDATTRELTITLL